MILLTSVLGQFSVGPGTGTVFVTHGKNVEVLGDWNVTAPESYENQTIYLDGNLTVLAGGSLTLKNTTLMLNLSENGAHWLKIYGSLLVFDIDNDSGTGQDSSVLCSNASGFSYQVDFYDGSVIRMSNSQVTKCGFSGTYRGLTVNTPNAIFEGMNFTGNYYGLYIKKTGSVVRNCTFFGNAVGMDSYSAGFEFANNTISGSSSDGLSIYMASPIILNSRFYSNWNGLNLRYSDAIVESCTISGSLSSGINFNSCSPLLVNSTLGNARDLSVAVNSFPRLLNTTFNASNASIGFGLYASVGQFMAVQVVNGTGQPMNNVTVSVLDGDGNPASNGITDSAGESGLLSFREGFLTETGFTGFGSHRLIAFSSESGTVYYGENITALAANDICNITVQEDPAGVEVWLDPTIMTAEWRNNSKIIAMGNVQVDWGGSLFVNNSEVMLFSCQSFSMFLTCENGALGISNTSVFSIGTVAQLAPGRIEIGVGPGCPAILEEVKARWTESIYIYSDLAIARDIDVKFASTCGVEVASDSSPLVENVSVEWASAGLYMLSDRSTIRNVSLSNVRDYGVYASGSKGSLSNMSVARASKGVYSPSSVITFSDLNIQNCAYGIHALYGHVQVINSTILASTSYGVYSLGGGLRMSGCQISSSPTGLRLQDTSYEMRLDSCTITGNNCGLSVKSCKPVILNSTLSNPLDVSVDRATTASLVNCSLAISNVTVSQSGYVDIGNWAYALVSDKSKAPAEGCTVSILDSSGQVSASGITDANGLASPLAYRERRILWNRTELYPEHRVLAFMTANQSWLGSNVTSLSPGDQVDVSLSEAGGDWLHWPGDHVVMAGEYFEGRTIVAGGNVVVSSSGTLSLNNSTLWVYAALQTGTEISASGSMDMCNVTLAPLNACAPLQPATFSIVYEKGSEGKIAGCRISNLAETVLKSDLVQFTDTGIERASMSGVRIESASPLLKNVTLSMCYDGMTSNSASPRIANSTFVENGRYGFTASAGAPEICSTLSHYNYIGFTLNNGATGSIDGCTATKNTHGIYLSTASPVINASDLFQNTNYGAYFYNSYAIVTDCQITRNVYGAYCSYSSPSFEGSNISSNTFGFYLYYSGPYISDCQLDANSYGIYQIGEGSNQETTVFSSGRDTEVATLVGVGNHDGYGITLPKRARLKDAGMTVEGILLKNEAVLEDPYFQMGHAIFDNWLVWHDNRDGNWEIYAYDLSMDSDFNGVPNYMETPPLENNPALVRITNQPAAQFNPDIWGDTIVWMDMRNGNSDIYAYTFANDTEWPVAVATGDQSNPSIYGDHIVWSDDTCGCGSNKIFMLTISNGTVSSISDSPWDDYSPEIFNNRVVWYSYTGSPGGPEFSDVYMFDINSWECKQITKDDPLQYNPTVYENYIVWHDDRNVNWEIYLYNISTGFEERITNEEEQSFCPEMWGNRIVYYFHDRIKDDWAVRMYDVKGRVQTDIEPWMYGDAHPVIYEDRVAWLNKTEIRHDLYVMDFNIMGWPANVSIDLGQDGDAEFVKAGEFKGLEEMNSSLLLAELESFVPGAGRGTVDIPLNISFEGPGRVGLASLSITYDLPAFIEETTISNSSCGIYCGGARPLITNTTFSDDSTDIRADGECDPVLLNSDFSESKLQFMSVLANVTIQNFLHVMAEDNGLPVNAGLLVLDNSTEVFNGTMGEDGTVMWLAVTDARLNSTGRYENVTTVSVDSPGISFPDNPRDVDMGASHWEIFSRSQLSLKKGWNMVSLPFEQASVNGTLIGYASDIVNATGCTVAAKWNASSQSYTTYISGFHIYSDAENFEIGEDDAFWLWWDSEPGGFFSLTGNAPGPRNVHLLPGWNSIAYKNPVAGDAGSLWAPQVSAGIYDDICWFDGHTFIHYIFPGTEMALAPTRGYFVWSDNETWLNY